MSKLLKSIFVISLVINIIYITQDNSDKLSFIKPSNPDLEFPIQEFNQDSSPITAKESLRIEKEMKFNSNTYQAKVTNELTKKDRRDLATVNPSSFNDANYDEFPEERGLPLEEPSEIIYENQFDLKEALTANGSFSEEDYDFYQDLDRQRSLEISEYISELSEGSDLVDLDNNENGDVAAINQKYKDLLLERVGEDNFQKYEDTVSQLNQQSIQDSPESEQFYLLDF